MKKLASLTTAVALVLVVSSYNAHAGSAQSNGVNGSVLLKTYHPAPHAQYESYYLKPHECVDESCLPAHLLSGQCAPGTTFLKLNEKGDYAIEVCNHDGTNIASSGQWKYDPDTGYMAPSPHSNPMLRVGWGMDTPKMQFHIEGNMLNSGILSTGDIGQGSTVPDLEIAPLDSKAAFIWIPNKAALRAGSVWADSSGHHKWKDELDIGVGSVAFGRNNLASGSYAFVAGQSNEATGGQSFVGAGFQNKAEGPGSAIAAGYRNTVELTGSYSSIVGGKENILSGEYSSILGGGGVEFDTGNNVSGNYSTIVGGGAVYDAGTNVTTVAANTLHSDYSIIGGGSSNHIGEHDYSGIFSGENGTISVTGGSHNVILGGKDITIQNFGANPTQYTAIVGGLGNQSVHSYSFVGGGQGNACSSGGGIGSGPNDPDASNIPDYCTIAGGQGNLMSYGKWGTIGGGQNNKLTNIANHSVVAGGKGNTIVADKSVISGGESNVAGISTSGIDNEFLVIAGGFSHAIAGVASTISGGYDHSIKTISDGAVNYATIAGGYQNQIYSDYGVISGGDSNVVLSSNFGTIVGGQDNVIFNAPYSAVLGGVSNVAGGPYAIVGGFNSTAGENSVALGKNMHMTGKRSFVFGSTNASPVPAITTDDVFLVYPHGGENGNGKMGVGTDTPLAMLHVKDTIMLEPRPAAPACTSATEGMLYSDSTSHTLCHCDGSIWRPATNTGIPNACQ